MDDIFQNISMFTCDVLLFSKTKAEHYAHLHIVFTLFEKHGLIVSRKKMKLAVKHIDFLGQK